MTVGAGLAHARNHVLLKNQKSAALTRRRAVPALHPRLDHPAPIWGTQRARGIAELGPRTDFEATALFKTSRLEQYFNYDFNKIFPRAFSTSISRGIPASGVLRMKTSLKLCHELPHQIQEVIDAGGDRFAPDDLSSLGLPPLPELLSTNLSLSDSGWLRWCL